MKVGGLGSIKASVDGQVPAKAIASIELSRAKLVTLILLAVAPESVNSTVTGRPSALIDASRLPIKDCATNPLFEDPEIPMTVLEVDAAAVVLLTVAL